MKKGIELWVTEDYEGVFRMQYKAKETLYSGESEFQRVDVIDTDYLGKALFNDGLIMTSERDEFIYHEMITHVPMSVHPSPKKVLIIGGGDGGTAREVLRYESVERVVMVEIDPCVIEACKKHLPVTSCELENPKLELRIEDGIKYVKETAEKFDVILVDSTDPIGPAAPLFDVSFYSDIRNALTENGIVVSQCENPFIHMTMQKKLLGIKAEIFEKVSVYNYTNMTYPGGLWSFSFASKGLDPMADFKPLPEAMLSKMKYYNSALHKAAFALPNFQKNEVQDFLK